MTRSIKHNGASVRKYRLLILTVLFIICCVCGCGGKAAQGESKEQAAQSTEAAATGSKESESKESAAGEDSTAGTAGEAVSEAAKPADAKETSGDTGAGAAAEAPAAAERKAYESKDGWKLSYDEAAFSVDEASDSKEVSFKYTGESIGTDAVTVSYHPEMMPDAVLYEKTADIADEQVRRSEGWFAGNTYWAHTRSVAPKAGDADAVSLQYTAIEHNGGTVLVEILMHEEADEGKQMAIMDTIADLVDSFELVNHEPQTEYAYIPGSYVREYTEEIEGKNIELKDTIVLNEDHTCEVDFQDTIPGDWTGTKIMLRDGTEFEFKVEGDKLFMEMSGEWVEFTRQ